MRPLAFREPSPRKPTLRTRRRRTRVLMVAGVIAILGFSAFGVRALSYQERFAIAEVNVTGVEAIDPSRARSLVEEILDAKTFTFLSRRNILFYPRSEIETTLRDTIPHIERVQVSRESLLGNALTVTIRERDHFAQWCSESACFAMDASGYVFAEATTTDAFSTPYVFEGSISADGSPIGQVYLPGRLAGVLTFLERLGQNGIRAEQIAVDGEQDYSVMVAPGYAIRAVFGSDVGLLVKNLELILGSEALRGKEEQLEYIDLRFGNRVYYRLKGAQQEAINSQ